MRTTLTLDDDVAALLTRVREQRALGLKETVNQALRLGLREMNTPPRRRATHRTHSVSLGRCLIGDLDDVAEVLAATEGDAFR
jgi:hypothetical protein